MKILAWVSTRGTKLDTASELSALHRIEAASGVTVDPVVDRPFDQLAGILTATKPDVFHFIGHGNNAGEFLMSDSIGLEHFVTPADLARALRVPDGGGVEGVVLNACFSSRAAHAVAPRGGWVVAMDATIFDDAATEFTSAFYAALAARQNPREASRAARAHLALAGYSHQDHLARLLPGAGHGFYQSRRPRDDDRNRDALEHVASVFNRSAFRTPAIAEGSFNHLKDALDHTALALGTGHLVSRAQPTIAFSTIPPHLLGAPAVRALSNAVGPLLDQARGVLSRLEGVARELGAVQYYDAAYRDLQSAGRSGDAEALLLLMDEMDEVRNKIMRRVNRVLADHDVPPLSLIVQSSGQVAQFGI